MLPLQITERELLPDCLDLRLTISHQPGENVIEHPVDHVKNLVVVLVENHLHVQACELREVAVGVGVLSSEYGADLKDPLHVPLQRHLLVQLRRLRHVRHSIKVPQLENVRPSLRRRRNQLGGVDLSEGVLQHVLPEQAANVGLDAENPLVCPGAQVEDSVVQADLLVHADEAGVGFELGLGPAGVLHLQGERLCSGDAVEPLHLQLHPRLRATLDLRLRDAHGPENVHHGLPPQEVGEPRDFLAEDDGLDRGRQRPAQLQEAQLVSLCARLVDAGPNPHLLILHAGFEVAHISPLAAGLHLGLDEQVAVRAVIEVQECQRGHHGLCLGCRLRSRCGSLLGLLGRFLLFLFLLLLELPRFLLGVHRGSRHDSSSRSAARGGRAAVEGSTRPRSAP
mmetsp:Transcript_19456/g.46937  ORF Transcript_19456/g.46937 Transcript_19456/m.46937 type:complete len:395 (+) Transcript_19456:650-1834(+)